MNRSLLIGTFLAMTLLLSAGCATKQFVRNSTKPIDDRLAEVGERSTSNSARLDTLNDQVERDVSRLDERSLSAQTRADEAVDRAANARAAADDAAEAATRARDIAERGLAGVDGLNEALRDMQDFDMVHGESVYFGFDSSELDEKALTSLGQIASAASAAKTYAVVVKGFADSTGAKEYNMALSKKRAESAVRHLTTTLADSALSHPPAWSWYRRADSRQQDPGGKKTESARGDFRFSSRLQNRLRP